MWNYQMLHAYTDDTQQAKDEIIKGTSPYTLVAIHGSPTALYKQARHDACQVHVNTTCWYWHPIDISSNRGCDNNTTDALAFNVDML